MRGFVGLFAVADPPSDAGPSVQFDGTLYNCAELVAGLTHPPVSDRAEDLILALYAQHGAAFVERLRGPFALALRDGSGAGLLARDASGLRTLYYFHDEPGGRFAFATGVRPLAESGTIPVQLDARGLYGFFRHGALPEPFTMVAGVHALETGGRLLWQGGRVTRERFRPLPRVTGDESLRAALLDSVDQHLADCAAAAVFVGGGIGSAALLALARETGREKNLRALTVGFDDNGDHARRTAEHFGVPHTHLRLDRARARAWFDDYLAALDQPGVHGFPLFALCRFAREEGIGVALAGIGAGELFGGSPLYAQLPRLMAWSGRLGPLRATAGRALLASSKRPAAQRLGDFFTRPPTLAGAYAAVRGIHSAEEARAIVARFTDPTGCADPVPEDVSLPDDFPTTADAIRAMERRRLREQVLRDASALGRAHDLELRLPFVDVRVAQCLAAMRLQDAVPEIPAWVGARRPHFPYETWRAAEWGASKPADTVNRPVRRTWEQKWSLFLFRRWWRQFAKR